MFHVFIRLNESEADQVLFVDLSEADLQRKFVTPYLEGSDIFDDGSIIRMADIGKITVLSSALTADGTLRKMAADHQAELERIKRVEGLNVMGSYCGREVTELIGYCEDVTQRTIARGPGTGTRRTKVERVLVNPWIVAIGSGVLLLLFAILGAKLWGNG